MSKNIRSMISKNKSVFVAVFVLLVGAVFMSGNNNTDILKPAADSAIKEYAQEVLAACSGSNHHPSCYDKEIPKLMDYISMEDAFRVTRIVQDNDSSYQYCHVLGHELSAREIQKDPSKWKEVVSRCPSGMCSNGCIHGGFQERFRAESFTDDELSALKPDLIDLCEERANWKPTGLEQGSCYHALGHLTMYLTDADLDRSIDLCEEIALKDGGRDYRQLCFDGVFMQIFQPLEPEDFALVIGKQPTKEEVPQFCGRFSDTRKASCLSESWPLFSDQIKQPEGLVKFCSMSEPNHQGRCYLSMFYVLTPQFNFDLEKIASFCSGMPGDLTGRCFANAASRMIETDYRNIDKSIELCKIAEPYDHNGYCYDEMVFYSTFNFHPNSPEALKVCEQMKEPWKQKCLAKQL